MDNKHFILGGGLLVLSLALIFGLSRMPERALDETETVEELSEEPVPEIEYLFGLPINDYEIEVASVQPNQNLSEILLNRGISYSQIDALAKRSKPIFDVRKMKAGKTCTFFWNRDSTPAVEYMVYERSIEEFVVYGFRDSVTVSAGQKEIVFEERTVAGTIESSPWNAMLDKGVSTRLAIELEDIYAWSIDFTGVQKGDEFRIIYTVKMIDGEAIGIDQVLACSFSHGGKEHQAVGFVQNNQFNYFDENGQSLKRAFLKAPLKSYRISSRYTKSRFHPILRIYRPHSGVDYAAPTGTPIFAIGDGKIVKKGRDKSAGNYLRIKHNSVYSTGYNHLSNYAKGVKLGSYVKQNQIIGYVGSTGYATGPHLDFRMYKNGTAVDPLKVKSPPVEPVQASLRPQYDSVAQDYAYQLSALRF